MESANAVMTKQVSFLREQLKTFDMEMELKTDSYDAAKNERILHLEEIINEYKAQIQQFQQNSFQPVSIIESRPSSPVIASPVNLDDYKVGCPFNIRLISILKIKSSRVFKIKLWNLKKPWVEVNIVKTYAFYHL